MAMRYSPLWGLILGSRKDLFGDGAFLLLLCFSLLHHLLLSVFVDYITNTNK